MARVTQELCGVNYLCVGRVSGLVMAWISDSNQRGCRVWIPHSGIPLPVTTERKCSRYSCKVPDIISRYEPQLENIDEF